MLDLAGQKVLVLGLGVSGQSAARFCAARGASVVAADERAETALGPLADLEAVSCLCGAPLPDPAAFDLVVPSPGVPRERYAARARRVWGDVELAWRALPVPLVAITGTNGKSTVTRRVEGLLRAAGLRAEAAGNIGRPALELVGRPLDVAVLEVSSFQLETTDAFRPRVAAILNLSPDHLDRHGTAEAYREAKARILANQGPEDAAVLNRDDPAVWSLAPRTRARVFGFSLSGALERGVGFDSGNAVLYGPSGAMRLPLDGARLGPRMERENTLAALCVVAALGADLERALRGVERFEPLPHRLQPVAVRGGVTWIDDSKATNVGAACRALESFPGGVVWIGGGRDKGLDFGPLRDAARGRVRAALLIGESAAALERTLADVVPCERVGDLDRAVARADSLARPGDTVLLAPACASFDQFRDFEERGVHFGAAVAALPAPGKTRAPEPEEGRA